MISIIAKRKKNCILIFYISGDITVNCLFQFTSQSHILITSKKVNPSTTILLRDSTYGHIMSYSTFQVALKIIPHNWFADSSLQEEASFFSQLPCSSNFLCPISECIYQFIFHSWTCGGLGWALPFLELPLFCNFREQIVPC